MAAVDMAVRIITDPEDWDGELPALAVAAPAGVEERRALLRRLVARTLGRHLDAIAIAHEPGRAPRLVRPEGTGLLLSSASREGFAALALARSPVGVDVERVEPDRDPPWNVLHPAERRWLEDTPVAARARAFARLWAVKEAYLKAVGTGLVRGSEFVHVAVPGDGTVSVREAGIPVELASFETWREFRDASFAVCAIRLPIAGVSR